MKNLKKNSANNFQSDFKAKKSLGQNFLHAPQVISAMVHAGEISKESTVLEIGPGKGVLTEKLLLTEANIIAIEKDDRAISFLKEKFDKEIKNGKLKLIHGDILEFDEIELEKYIIIANIPYYITGEFMRKFLETENQPERIVVTLQKEVAKRIVDKKESILSISVKAYGNPRYLMTVPKKFFRPMPNVDSAVLIIDNISKKFFTDSKIDEKSFFEILKAGFAHKRKVLIRNLEEKIPKKTLEMIWGREGISKNIRAENVTLEMWKRIVGESFLS
ncbi:MAG: 16S rRNA (adenine(1518)-N(6)/adenine(1519)-N(6))-dimethyltransferase RsmA [Patescibacteria group bacterium]